MRKEKNTAELAVPDSTAEYEPRTGANPPETQKVSAWRAFWVSVLHFDAHKMKPWIAFRNTVGATAPLAVCLLAGVPQYGLPITLGALQVAYSDGDDAYSERAKRMLLASVLGALAVVAGGLVGGHKGVAIAVLALCAFFAGLVVALGENAGNQGLISLVTLIIYAAQPVASRTVLLMGLLALGGGVLQTVLSLIFWPVRRLLPEQRAIGELYGNLARLALSCVRAAEAPPLTSESTQAQQTLAGLTGDYSAEGERLWSLLSQAERIRLQLLALRRLQHRLARMEQGREAAEQVNSFLKVAATVLEAVAHSLSSRSDDASVAVMFRSLDDSAERMRVRQSRDLPAFLMAVLRDTVWQMDALAGQLRASDRLARRSTSAPGVVWARTHLPRNPLHSAREQWSRLRANLTLQSSACRHALRMAMCIGLGQAIATQIPGRRAYWLPMTVVLVLKPEFAATFTRGLLRIAGTIVGLALATAMFHFMAANQVLEVALLAVFIFALRWVGAANYGVFTVAVSGAVVLMVVFTGVEPKAVILARGLMTCAGGAIALLAYAAWPTWERTQVHETLARLLDSYAAYMAGTMRLRRDTDAEMDPELSRSRQAARLARTTLESSLDRLRLEPGTPASSLHFLNTVLASSHRFVHAAMAIEASPPAAVPPLHREAVDRFTSNVQRTLTLLAALLRGEHIAKSEFPDLREDYNAIVKTAPEQKYSQLVTECDRITNSVNTVREQIVRRMSARREPAAGHEAAA